MKHNVCFRCGRKFAPVRSDQMYCCKACLLKQYASVRKALAEDKKEKRKTP